MADTPDNETEKAPEEEPAVEAAAPQETAVPEAAAPDAAPAPQDAPEEAAAASEDAASSTSAPAAQAEPAELLSPKERRRKARSAHTGEKARPARSPEDRHAERVAERKLKAARRRARRSQERAKRVAARGSGVGASSEPLAPVHAPKEGARKERQGVVVSNKADKTITVRIDTARRHRRYEKIVRSSSTLHAHDENNDAHEGDVVRVVESRPLSRTKRWRLVDVLERAR
jgi:small subunit ribosomal protein S17